MAAGPDLGGVVSARDHADGYPHTANARLPTHDRGIEGDSIELSQLHVRTLHGLKRDLR
jgi:hypothetical protein